MPLKIEVGRAQSYIDMTYEGDEKKENHKVSYMAWQPAMYLFAIATRGQIVIQ